MGNEDESGDAWPTGYSMSGEDNDSYMLSREGTPSFPPVRNRDGLGYPACLGCGIVTDRRWVNPAFRLQRKQFDLSHTYDGYTIVSMPLRLALESSQSDLEFIALPSEPHFFVLLASKVVRFDSLRRRTSFEHQCPICHRYFAIAGARPAFLLIDEPLPSRVFRCDVEFGTGNEQHPLLLVGSDLARSLMATGLKGPHFERAYGLKDRRQG